MSSGGKRIVFNPRERAVTPDVTRLQAFSQADQAEAARYLYQAALGWEVGSTLVSNPSTTTNPLTATVLGGLMAQPSNGTSNMFVTPGVLYAVFPDGTPNPDDSPNKFVSDPGVQTNGVLILTANGGGGIRIDVLECQPVETVSEVDSRDIFDPGTGLFAPANVNKVAAYKLNYRIRVGTSGAGFPGTASGWLPLCVMSVPVGAANWDAVELWDVRPLAPARSHGPFNNTVTLPKIRRQLVDTVMAAGPLVTLTGEVEVEQGSYALGGILKGVPAASTNFVEVTNAANQETGFAFSSHGIYYVYFVTPFSLPRWARYYAASLGARNPQTMGGIPTVSATVPDQTGLAAVGVPSATGLGAGTWSSFAAIAAAADGSSVPSGVICDGVCSWLATDGSLAIDSSLPATAVGSPTPTSSAFNLVDGTTHPPHAKAVYVRFSLGLSALNTPSKSNYFAVIEMFNFSGTAVTQSFALEGASGQLLALTTSDPISRSFVMRIPLQPAYPAHVGAPLTRKVVWASGVGGQFGFSSSSASVIGWEL